MLPHNGMDPDKTELPNAGGERTNHTMSPEWVSCPLKKDYLFKSLYQPCNVISFVDALKMRKPKF